MLIGDDDFELRRCDDPMSVSLTEDEQCVVVTIGEVTRHLSAEEAREMALGFENGADKYGEQNDEYYQAKMLRRAAERLTTEE